MSAVGRICRVPKGFDPPAKWYEAGGECYTGKRS